MKHQCQLKWLWSGRVWQTLILCSCASFISFLPSDLDPACFPQGENKLSFCLGPYLLQGNLNLQTMMMHSYLCDITNFLLAILSFYHICTVVRGFPGNLFWQLSKTRQNGRTEKRTERVCWQNLALANPVQVFSQVSVKVSKGHRSPRIRRWSV